MWLVYTYRMKTQTENDNFMSTQNMSITELKQLLSRVNHDLKMNKPTIKRIIKPVIIEPSEYDIVNSIAKRFTNKQYNKPVENARLIADIQIQKDILEFLNNGNVIITRNTRKKIKPLSFKSAVVSL